MAKKVLVIDDNENTVKYLSVVLSENGYEPSSACDGEQGLEKLKESKPDLVVLDVMMPKKSGLTLFKIIKKDDELKDVPILMLTGVAGILEEEEAHADETDEHPYDSLREALKTAIQKMRADGLVKPEMFVDKPVDVESFVAKVQGLIGE